MPSRSFPRPASSTLSPTIIRASDARASSAARAAPPQNCGPSWKAVTCSPSAIPPSRSTWRRRWRSGGYRMDLHAEDADLWWRMARHYDVRCIPKALVGFRQSEQSVSSRYLESQQLAALYVQYLLLSDLWGLQPQPLSEVSPRAGGLPESCRGAGQRLAAPLQYAPRPARAPARGRCAGPLHVLPRPATWPAACAMNCGKLPLPTGWPPDSFWKGRKLCGRDAKLMEAACDSGQTADVIGRWNPNTRSTRLPLPPRFELGGVPVDRISMDYAAILLVEALLHRGELPTLTVVGPNAQLVTLAQKDDLFAEAIAERRPLGSRRHVGGHRVAPAGPCPFRSVSPAAT